jgi:prepilin-type N-terminal cleavage/methylation domain-containing protein
MKQYLLHNEESHSQASGISRTPGAFERQIASPATAPKNTGRRWARRERRQMRRSGFTLIEIAVALAIFVVGALAIVRIFPAALSVVQTSEQRAIAMRLSQSTLARYASNDLSVPHATYDYDATLTSSPGYFSDFGGAVVGTANRNSSLPNDPPRPPFDTPGVHNTDFGQSSLSRFRRIVGEKHKVVQGNYVLTNFAIHEVDPIRAYREREVLNVQIRNVPSSTDTGELDFTDAVLADDTSTAFNERAASATGDPVRPPILINSRPREEITFYVSYRWVGPNGRINGVVDEPKEFPNPAGWNANDHDPGRVLQSFIGTNRVIPGSVRVWYREPITVSPTNEEKERGFVPIPGLGAGSEVSIDYTVDDWRTLIVDSSPITIPEDAPATAKFPRLITTPTRDVSTDADVRSLLIGYKADGSFSGPLVGEWDVDNDAYTGNIIDVKPKLGHVMFDINDSGTPNAALLAPRARVLYRNIDGWAQQTSVAAKSYIPYVGTPSGTDLHPREPWREYLQDTNGRLYFHASEAGKTVMVSFEYLDANNVYRTVNGQLVTIKDDLSFKAPTDLPGFRGEYKNKSNTNETPIDVAEAQLTDLTGNAATNVTAILSVQGVSVQSRSAWYEGSRYSQVTLGAYRSLK